MPDPADEKGEGDGEEERAGGPPPHPLDRIWFHPSELRSLVPGRTAPPTGRRLARIAFGGALGAAAVGLVTLAAVARLGDDERTPTRGPRAFERGVATARMVETAGVSIVAVRVVRPEGVTILSGVVIADDRVLTSAHALDGEPGVSIANVGGVSDLAAVVAGTDDETDLALLRVDGLTSPPARLGSAGWLRKGNPVLAVATGAKRRWVSVGVVSSSDRTLATNGSLVVAGLVETETGAGREQAGGAVLDRDGAVVGILMVPPGVSSSGLAVPVDIARDVTAQLEAAGHVEHGWLGVTGSDEVERAGGGARIDEVRSQSPAERSGLVAGDVVVAVGDTDSATSVSNAAELLAEIRRRHSGEGVELAIVREGARRHVSVTLSRWVDEQHADTVTTTTPAADG